MNLGGDVETGLNARPRVVQMQAGFGLLDQIANLPSARVAMDFDPALRFIDGPQHHGTRFGLQRAVCLAAGGGQNRPVPVVAVISHPATKGAPDAR